MHPAVRQLPLRLHNPMKGIQPVLRPAQLREQSQLVGLQVVALDDSPPDIPTGRIQTPRGFRYAS